MGTVSPRTSTAVLTSQTSSSGTLRSSSDSSVNPQSQDTCHFTKVGPPAEPTLLTPEMRASKTMSHMRDLVADSNDPQLKVVFAQQAQQMENMHSNFVAYYTDMATLEQIKDHGITEILKNANLEVPKELTRFNIADNINQGPLEQREMVIKQVENHFENVIQTSIRCGKGLNLPLETYKVFLQSEQIQTLPNLKTQYPPDYAEGLPSCDEVEPKSYEASQEDKLLSGADEHLTVAQIEEREKARLLNQGPSTLGRIFEWATNAIRLR